jgi:hypothetical protein
MGNNVSRTAKSAMEANKDDLAMFYDDRTMQKVYSALCDSKLNHTQIMDAIDGMQKAGIFFRERNKA